METTHPAMCLPAGPFSGKTVVVTHHRPSAQSLHQRHLGEAFNTALVGEVDELARLGNLWLLGDLRNQFEFNLNRCRSMALSETPLR